ncbi:MAG: glycosyl hydrolase, partial [Luteimonas sp.]|nr:glycosyl hydrolase [Luteimonas sp.]
SARVWITTADHAQALAVAPEARFGQEEARAIHIEVDTDQRYQRMLGFGAAITDASAWLIQHRMSPTQRDALLRELFGREGDGVGFGFTRLTIGASDFSRHHYSLDDVPAGESDPELAHFSIAPNRGDVIPVTRAALAVNPDLKVMASPWSAPAWMKTTDSLIQGTLQPQYYDAFARYLVRYVDAYAAEGIPIFALTLQNEPSFEPKDYPGMRLSAQARAQIIGLHLGPMLAQHATTVQIFDWDHNWDLPQEPSAVLADPVASRYVSAVAWHCYAGEVSAQSQVHDAYPDKDAYLTECSGGTWEPVKSGGLTLQARQLVIGTTRNWARGVLFWNLALDENRGPHAGGCDTCRGIVTIDSRNGTVTRTDDYYALAHASRFVRPGAWRVASSEAQSDVDNVAFLNPDDGSIVLVVTNSAAAPREVSIGEAQRRFAYTLPGKSLATFVWHAAGR